LGAAGYFGKTQSRAYDGLNTNDAEAVKAADSTVVGITMIGLDARYTYKAFQARGQFLLASVSNTKEYNTYTGKDLGSQMIGGYAELGYDVINIFKKDAKEKLIVFGRYEIYNTHDQVSEETTVNDTYGRTDMTFGLTYKVANGAAFKLDYQIFDNRAEDNEPANQINAGVGIWF